MITFLDGIIEDKQPTHLVLNVGGVGYEVVISLNSFDRLPAAGEKARILIHDHIREDAHLLFGFMTEDERRVFTLLLSVSGIGPKTALSVLSGMSVREVKVAIKDADIKRLSSISGIGKKTAERMVVELRDKFTSGEILSASSGQSLADSDVRLRDAVLALVSLGYKRGEAQDLVLKASAQPSMAGADVESLVRKALAG
jgi:Holliday junction DNA helicase RuvA